MKIKTILSNKRFIAALLLLGAVIGIRFLCLGYCFTLAGLKAGSAKLSAFVAHNYMLSVIAYILFYITTVSLSLPAAMLTTIAGGYLFGVVWGTLYANIGATIGATVSFLTVRYLIGAVLQKRYQKQLAGFNAAMEQDGTSYLIAIHFVAIIPFFVINMLAGLTEVPLWTFVWTTSLGILPGSTVYTFAGQQLHKINAIQDIFSPGILLAFVLLTLLSLLPILIRRMRKA